MARAKPSSNKEQQEPDKLLLFFSATEIMVEELDQQQLLERLQSLGRSLGVPPEQLGDCGLIQVVDGRRLSVAVEQPKIQVV